MTSPQQQQSWSTKGLHRLATAFVGQEHVGILGGLLLRLARFLQGDPVVPVVVAVPFGANPGLPDDVRATTAVLQVTGNPVSYRADGGLVLATDPQLQVGAIVTLTGQPTLKGFRVACFVAAGATLTGNYFD